MGRDVKLFYHPASSCSQKVVVALEEKGVKHQPVVVDIRKPAQQLESWYMRINPLGLVPVLLDGDTVVRESEDIVDYIDKEFPGETKLVPDMSTEIGREVSSWRKLLVDEVRMVVVTYGTFCHQDLSVTGVSVPTSMYGTESDMTAYIQIRAKRCEQLADKYPDLREAYMAKSLALQKQSADIADRDKVIKALDLLESTLDKVEEKLKMVNADPLKGVWFCGQQFTAADITLCILLGRLDILGLGVRYHSSEKRPKLHLYWQHAQKRTSIKRNVVNSSCEVMKMKIIATMKTALPIVGGLVTVGLAAGLAFLFATKH